jgi:hypothetical protein
MAGRGLALGLKGDFGFALEADAVRRGCFVWAK